jgi:hypothetical protein
VCTCAGSDKRARRFQALFNDGKLKAKQLTTGSFLYLAIGKSKIDGKLVLKIGRSTVGLEKLRAQYNSDTRMHDAVLVELHPIVDLGELSAFQGAPVADLKYLHEAIEATFMLPVVVKENDGCVLAGGLWSVKGEFAAAYALFRSLPAPEQFEEWPEFFEVYLSVPRNFQYQAPANLSELLNEDYSSIPIRPSAGFQKVSARRFRYRQNFASDDRGCFAFRLPSENVNFEVSEHEFSLVVHVEVSSWCRTSAGRCDQLQTRDQAGNPVDARLHVTFQVPSLLFVFCLLRYNETSLPPRPPSCRP